MSDIGFLFDIKPCGNSSDWEAVQHDELSSLADEKNGSVGTIYDFEDDDLPTFVEDIRGCIRREPEYVFVEVIESENENIVQYWGFCSMSQDEAKEWEALNA